MKNELIETVFGCLLHDIGKAVQRAGGSMDKHSIQGWRYLSEDIGLKDIGILNSVHYHHKRELGDANIPNDSIAYIAYIADNIASASDRRNENEENAQSGWDREANLESIFNLLNGRSDKRYYKPVSLDINNGINFPEVAQLPFDAGFYNKVLVTITDALKRIDFRKEYINSLLEVFESTLSYVPSSTNKSEVADISLFDHMKLSAAIGSCIYQYIDSMDGTAGRDYRKILFDDEKAFYTENFALLYSLDMSGIQDFIYTIHSEGALKSLRARSFYLEVFMENMIDDLFHELDLTRANLLYSGGGHMYALLANTDAVVDILNRFEEDTNKWLSEMFETTIGIAAGFVPCSAEALRNEPKGSESYSDLFRQVSNMISEKKLRRYSPDVLIGLNNTHKTGRECVICKTVSNHLDGYKRCPICAALIEMSDSVQDARFFSVLKGDNSEGKHLLVTKGKYIVADKDEKSLQERITVDDNLVRSYGKNSYYTGVSISNKLWVGDYYKEKDLSAYAKSAGDESTGHIPRLGVVRMDVDNLGSAFTSGFAAEDGRYNTLSRTASFSRHLSLFFKRDINDILNNPSYRIFTKGQSGGRNVTIIYSGGDDIFLIGAWADALESAIDISNIFQRYAQGKLSISCGFGIYPGRYPVKNMAREVGELEDSAKSLDGKSAIALFEATGAHTYKWRDLIDRVIAEKYVALDDYFSHDPERGKGFLYKLLELIRNRREKINFARYAYLLSRMEPSKAEEERYETYRAFSQKMYDWMNDDRDSKELVTAIYLYVFSTRSK
jgi:CRISPR-associated protein Csm1